MLFRFVQSPLLAYAIALVWGAAPPARLLHRLPSLNGVVPQHPPPSHRLWWAGRNIAVRPDGDPLRVDRRRVGLEAVSYTHLTLPTKA